MPTSPIGDDNLRVFFLLLPRWHKSATRAGPLNARHRTRTLILVEFSAHIKWANKKRVIKITCCNLLQNDCFHSFFQQSNNRTIHLWCTVLFTLSTWLLIKRQMSANVLSTLPIQSNPIWSDLVYTFIRVWWQFFTVEGCRLYMPVVHIAFFSYKKLMSDGQCSIK